MWYPNYIPDWITRWFKSYVWHGDRNKNIVHLTFDDGPTPVITHFVLDLLDQHKMKATFFCIGDRVQKHPDLYQLLLDKGHAVGNHTMNHLNAWNTSNKVYLDNVIKANQYINSNLFRPPYGKMTPSINKELIKKGYTTVQWDVISGDFDRTKKANYCLQQLKRYTKNGSIIVFHDSKKAWPVLQEVLPVYLDFLKEKQLTSLPITSNA